MASAIAGNGRQQELFFFNIDKGRQLVVLLVRMILIQIGGIGVMTFTSFFALSFMGKSSFTSKMMLKDMLNEDRTGGLFRVILNILFVTLFIEGIGAYFIYMDVRGSLPGGTQQELFYAMFHAVSAFCNAGISTLSGNMYDPLVADKYNLHFWIAMLIIFGGLGFPIVFNYLKLLHHLLMNGIKILIGKQKHYIHTPRIINVHTYIVVISTLILLITGTAFYLFFEEGQYPDTPDQHRADNDDFPDRGEVRGIIDAQAYGTQGGNNLEQ